jgi:hypothetical protein
MSRWMMMIRNDGDDDEDVEDEQNPPKTESP